MGALETAKEIGRMTATATLGKDVIDLLKEKVTLLAEQVAALDTENSNLKRELVKLKNELTNLRQVADKLEEGAEKILRLLFESEDRVDVMETGEIAVALGTKEGIAKYHCDN